MEPDAGWLACGVTGVGRLPSPENIVAWLTKELQSLDGTGKLSGKNRTCYCWWDAREH